MNPFELSQLADLGNEVARLLRSELISTGVQVTNVANQVVISISKFEVEHRLGNLLQQIYRSVDQHIPVRKQDLSLVIRDVEGSYENSFKLWKSVA